jgi:6-phosphofructokinase
MKRVGVVVSGGKAGVKEQGVRVVVGLLVLKLDSM